MALGKSPQSDFKMSTFIFFLIFLYKLPLKIKQKQLLWAESAHRSWTLDVCINETWWWCSLLAWRLDNLSVSRIAGKTILILKNHFYRLISISLFVYNGFTSLDWYVASTYYVYVRSTISYFPCRVCKHILKYFRSNCVSDGNRFKAGRWVGG